MDDHGVAARRSIATLMADFRSATRGIPFDPIGMPTQAGYSSGVSTENTAPGLMAWALIPR